MKNQALAILIFLSLNACVSDTNPPPTMSNSASLSRFSSNLFKEILSKDNYGCGITQGNRIDCWGSGRVELFETPRFQPEKTIAQLVGGPLHACVLVDSAPHCWGFPVLADVPQELQNQSVLQLAAGGSATCALTIDGKIHCWGSSLVVDQMPDIRDASALALGEESLSDSQACAIRGSNRTVTCWGNVNAESLALSSSLSEVSEIQSNGPITCALSNQKVTCWGNGVASTLSSLIASSSPISLFALGKLGACLVKQNSDIECWDLSEGAGSHRIFSQPQLGKVVSLSTSGSRACAAFEFGSACWQVGSFSSWDDLGQASLPGSISSLKSTSLSTAGVCGIDSLGSPHCWGRVSGGLDESSLPKLNLLKFGSNSGFGCGLDLANQLICGTGTGGFSLVTQLPAHAIQDTNLTVGNGHACVLIDQKVLCWGNNVYSETSAPDLPLDGIATGDFTNCGFNHRDVICWGQNATQPSSPNGPLWAIPPPTGVNGIGKLALSDEIGCVLDSIGQIHCWGNEFSKLVESHYAVMTDIHDIAIQGQEICALRAHSVECFSPSPTQNLSFTRSSGWSDGVLSILIDEKDLCLLFSDRLQFYSLEEDQQAYQQLTLIHF